MKLRTPLTLITFTAAVCLSISGWAFTTETETADKTSVDAQESTSDRELSFNKDIRPIISDKCFHCHGPDANNQESDFRLDTEEHLSLIHI